MVKGSTPVLDKMRKVLGTNDFYEYSKMADLSLQSVQRLYWYSRSKRLHDTELRDFFWRMITYYSIMKQDKGGTDWMKQIPMIDDSCDEDTPSSSSSPSPASTSGASIAHDYQSSSEVPEVVAAEPSYFASSADPFDSPASPAPGATSPISYSTGFLIHENYRPISPMTSLPEIGRGLSSSVDEEDEAPASAVVTAVPSTPRTPAIGAGTPEASSPETASSSSHASSTSSSPVKGSLPLSELSRTPVDDPMELSTPAASLRPSSSSPQKDQPVSSSTDASSSGLLTSTPTHPSSRPFSPSSPASMVIDEDEADEMVAPASDAIAASSKTSEGNDDEVVCLGLTRKTRHVVSLDENEGKRKRRRTTSSTSSSVDEKRSSPVPAKKRDITSSTTASEKDSALRASPYLPMPPRAPVIPTARVQPSVQKESTPSEKPSTPEAVPPPPTPAWKLQIEMWKQKQREQLEKEKGQQDQTSVPRPLPVPAPVPPQQPPVCHPDLPQMRGPPPHLAPPPRMQGPPPHFDGPLPYFNPNRPPPRQWMPLSETREAPNVPPPMRGPPPPMGHPPPNGIWCGFCGTHGAHIPEHCPVYNTHDKRQARLKEIGLCLHCLELHDRRFCSERERLCPICAKHNTHVAFCRRMCR